MSEITRNVLDILFRVIFISGWIAAPIIMLIMIMYLYEKYKKWKDTERKEAERIIVKMNEDIVKTSAAINNLKPVETELKLSISALESKLKELKAQTHELQPVEVVIPEETTTSMNEIIAEEKHDSKELTIKDLHALARERKIKGFSRMKKEVLIKILGK